MKKVILFFFLSIIILGCQSGNHKQQSNDVAVIDLSKNYPKKEIILQEIADIEYIPLETRDDVLIGVPPVLSYVSDKFIIIRDMMTNSIFVFNRNGQITSHFNRRGEGDKEYVVCTNLFFDEKNEEIYVHDNSRNKIVVYSLTGDFKRAIKLSSNFVLLDLYNFDNETMLAYNNYNFTYRLDIPKEYNEMPYMLLSKKDGNIVSVIDIRMPVRYLSRIPIDLGGGMMTSLSIGCSANRYFGKDFIISDISSDTIYLLTQNRDLTPMLVRTPSVHSSEPRIVWTTLLTTDKFILFNKVTLDFYAAENNKEIPSSTLMYNFETGETNEVSFIDENYTMRKWTTAGLLGPEISKNMTADLIWPPRLKEADEKNQLKGELKKMVASIDIEDNPVVRIIKFK